MPNWFNRPLRLPKVKTSVFSLPNDYKTSIQFGRAVPVAVRECLPRDKFIKWNQEFYAQLAPLRFPTLHQMRLHSHNFFVPLRIILGEDLYLEFLQKEHPLPQVFFDYTPEDFVYDADMLTDYSKSPFINSIFDYLGYDILDVETILSEDKRSVVGLRLYLGNGLAYLAYLTIIRDWYLDDNLQSVIIDSIDAALLNYRDDFETDSSHYIGFDEYDATYFETFNVAYSKDYFNTARPAPQNGPDMYVLNRPLTMDGNPAVTAVNALVGGDGVLLANGDTPSELSETTSIRDLWRKEMLQRFYEVDNTFGKGRIREILAGHFGVVYSDKRIQIAQYMGGSSSTIQVDSVIQTSSTSGEETPLGTRGGKASSYSRSSSKKYFCEEHGVALSLVSIVPDNGYCQGMDRFHYKRDFFDFASPEFNNIGWQDVYVGELYNAANEDAGKETFGYQPRYSEYRTAISRVTGNFRTASLIGWHLNRYFTEKPVLNGNFPRVSDTKRIFSYEGLNAQDCPVFLDVFNDVVMSRPISYEPDSMHLY